MIAQLSPLILGLMSQIQSGKSAGVLHTWECNFRAGDTVIPVQFVNVVEVQRDYLGNYSDVINVSIKVDQVILNTVVYPNKDRLRLSLSRKPMQSEYTGIGATFESFVEYHAKLYSVVDHQMIASSVLTHLSNAQNKGIMTNVELQIYAPSLDIIRTSQYGTNHRNCSGADALVTALSNFISLPGDDNGVKGVELQTGYVKTLRDQIVIPHGTPIYRLPDMINLDSGGIYTTGFSHFIQRGIWYLFSPWDLSKYTRSPTYTLTIVNVPPSSLPGIERSYCINGREVILIATGDSKQEDNTERDQINKGTGVRFVDPSLQVNAPISNDAGKVTQPAKGYLNEVRTIERADNSALMTGKTRTSRYAIEYSEVAKRKGSTITLFWDNSYPDILIPGMAVKYIFMDKGKPVIRYGTLTGTINRSIIANKTALNPIYAYTSYLRLFIAKDEVKT